MYHGDDRHHGWLVTKVQVSRRWRHRPFAGDRVACITVMTSQDDRLVTRHRNHGNGDNFQCLFVKRLEHARQLHSRYVLQPGMYCSQALSWFIHEHIQVPFLRSAYWVLKHKSRGLDGLTKVFVAWRHRMRILHCLSRYAQNYHGEIAAELTRD